MKKQEQKYKPELFSFFPNPSLKWRYVSVNNKVLASNSGVKSKDNSYFTALEMFNTVFDFSKFGYKDLSDLVNAGKNGKHMFTCFIQTDGHGLSIQSARKKDQYTEDSKLKKEDFNKSEVEEYFLPCTIDPGNKQIFTASIGHSSNEHHIRRCSDIERRCYTGVRRKQAYVEKLKILHNVKELETNIPTSKTIRIEKLDVHINYMPLNLPRLLKFYGFDSAPFRFFDYQGRQKSQRRNCQHNFKRRQEVQEREEEKN
ncbi:hypothetical protein MFLAVUS_009621 [Mucor flavus]|uniref:Uncharacterized protein n=1 Tax=Mucor flavus TaxID=439312 RepID=A0ABP9ZAN1_9FUNG